MTLSNGRILPLYSRELRAGETVVMSTNKVAVDCMYVVALVAKTFAPEAQLVAGTAAPMTVTLDASESIDPDGSIVSYEWDLGDGSTADTQVVTHTYMTPGTYDVSLVVTDNENLVKTLTRTIVVK
jgi:PKD repeat protein